MKNNYTHKYLVGYMGGGLYFSDSYGCVRLLTRKIAEKQAKEFVLSIDDPKVAIYELVPIKIFKNKRF